MIITQIYLNHNTIKEKGLDADEVKKNILSQLNKDKRVLYAVDLEDVAEAAIPEPIKTRIIQWLQLAKKWRYSNCFA